MEKAILWEWMPFRFILLISIILHESWWSDEKFIADLKEQYRKVQTLVDWGNSS